jgi:predicted CXXCH cytochrome family protein
MRYSALILLAWTAAAIAAPPQSIINSPHNLSASGPGGVRATAEQEICIFCHTPHKASRTVPLWNRQMPVSAYKVYSSNSLNAIPGQPTGTSKLCLSCHDGTIALGSVLSRDMPIPMAGGITTLPPGRSNLGTDLSDDHPISFRYDSALAVKNTKLKDPAAVPASLRLDKMQEMQCSTCHNAHDNSNGKFLVMDNSNSQLCSSCHQLGTTDVAGHVQCASCHQPHTAPSGAHLLKAAKPTDACLACHSGGSGGQQGANIAADLALISRHDTGSAANLVTAVPNSSRCHDCHAPHTMRKTVAVAPNIQGNLGQVDGINAQGAKVTPARYEYEVCYKCHGDQQALQSKITRQIVQANTRLEFAAGSAVSYHPVQAAGRNSDVPSLLPGWTTASMVYCSDCHTSTNSRKAGGMGPNGTHGSNEKPLLAGGYVTVDNTAESPSAYGLCYRCHSRNSLLSETGPFMFHKKHIVDAKTPCSVCHDAHGISAAQGTVTKNSRLMNFDITVVKPDPVTGRLEYNNLGSRHGRCYLTCHGKPHSPKEY